MVTVIDVPGLSDSVQRLLPPPRRAGTFSKVEAVQDLVALRAAVAELRAALRREDAGEIAAGEIALARAAAYVGGAERIAEIRAALRHASNVDRMQILIDAVSAGRLEVVEVIAETVFQYTGGSYECSAAYACALASVDNNSDAIVDVIVRAAAATHRSMSIEMRFAYAFLTRNGRHAAQLFAAGGKVSICSFEAAAGRGGLTLAVPHVREFLAGRRDCAVNCLEMACSWHSRCGRDGECRTRTESEEDRADHFAYAEAAIEFGAPPTAQALALAAWPRGEALAAAIRLRWEGTPALEAAEASLRLFEAQHGPEGALAALSVFI